MSERYSLMAAERAEFPVSMMARLLGVSRSGFYAWLSRGAAADPWGALRAEVLRLWESSEGRWGAPTVLSRLEGPFAGATLYRVRSCMRDLGISGVHPRAARRTTVPDPGAPERPDLVRRDFRPPVPTTVLVGDTTYLRTGEGWPCLATVIDLATRMVVGWSMSARNDSALVVSALERAWARGYVAGGTVFHSDRGPTYMGRALAGWAAGHDAGLSCGRTGCCRDNAVAESFFGTLKNETCHLRAFATRREARGAVIDYVERYYNRARPHSTIGYQVPAERMGAFLARAERAFSEEVVPLESAA